MLRRRTESFSRSYPSNNQNVVTNSRSTWNYLTTHGGGGTACAIIAAMAPISFSQRLPALILTIAFAALGAAGDDNVDGFIARLHHGRSGRTMPYRLFIPPGYKKSNKYPLIMWLHGAGGIGSDNLRQIQGDQIPGTHLWARPEIQAQHPAFIVVPQSS